MSDGARVTIRELAAARGRKPEQLEAEAAELGLLVKPDRAGRRSLSVADARGLTTGEVRRLLEHNRAWEQHQRDTNDGSKAAAGLSPKPPGGAGEGRHPTGGGASPRRRGDAAVEAGRQYEKHNPRPSFGDGVYSVNLEYVEEVSA